MNWLSIISSFCCWQQAEYIRRIPELTRCSQQECFVADRDHLGKILPQPLAHPAGSDAEAVHPILSRALKDVGGIGKTGGYRQVIPIQSYRGTEEADFRVF